jgi:hypothetical protein
MFRFNNLLSCWRAGSERSVCEIDRPTAAKRVEEVQKILRASTLQNDNIFFFDPFVVLCPAEAATCSPYRNGRAIFRDQDHLNSLGAEELADDFLAFLRSNRLLVEAERK